MGREKLPAAVGVIAKTGTFRAQASPAQCNAASARACSASAGHGAAFRDGECLVLRFLESLQHGEYFFGGADDDVIRRRFCAAGYAGTEDTADVEPGVRRQRAGECRTAVRHQPGT